MKHARQKYLKSRPAPKSCEHCGKVSDELFAAIDDTCAAQCYHEPYLCRACFVKKYPREEYKFERAKNREEARRNIIDILMALPLGERRAVLIEVYGKLEESEAVQPNLEQENPNFKMTTNGDRIRAITDEELAGWRVADICHYCALQGKCGIEPCSDGVLAWLRQPEGE